MFIKPSHKKRFNLLLLGEGEHYYYDAHAVLYPDTSNPSDAIHGQIPGRLKICTKSVLFDPQDVSVPVTRYEYINCTDIGQCKDSLMTLLPDSHIFYITTNVTIEMKEGNITGAYKFKKASTTVRFELKYTPLQRVLGDILSFHEIAKLPFYEAEERINKVLDFRKRSIAFDLGWLDDLSEKQLTEVYVHKITPLVQNSGRLVLTDKVVYFQSFENVGDEPVEKYFLKEIVRVIKRRHALLQVGLELFYEQNDTPGSIFLAFRSQAERDMCDELMTSQPGMPKLDHESQSAVTHKWQCGLISNYDYLMYLNSLAGRSFNDFTQYPVFPWVVADYTSPTLDLENPATFRDLKKALGALNPDRLAKFKHRYGEMDEPKFLYGTHYSTPGYVLYYLVHTAPEYMLKLQNGRFDEPDRLFNSIPDCWLNVLLNPADLKELIPEFYDDTAFLLADNEVNLGKKQDGTKVGNIKLPAWANSAEDFIKKHRQALECEYVSSSLNLWIDLIFGYKQQGDESIKANNVFHPLTYEGAVDINKISDPLQKSAMIMQINEFGQCPKQIFDAPHPTKYSPHQRASKAKLMEPPEPAKVEVQIQSPPTSPPEKIQPQPRSLADMIAMDTPILEKPSFSLSTSDFLKYEEPSLALDDPIFHSPPEVIKLTPSFEIPTSRIDLDLSDPVEIPWGPVEVYQPQTPLKLHRDACMAVCLTKDDKSLFSVSKDSTLKVYSLKDNRQQRSTNIGQLALSAVVLSQDQRHALIGSWDNTIYLYSMDYGRVQDTIKNHSDAVSCMASYGTRMLSGSWDACAMFWEVTESGLGKSPLVFHGNSEVRAVDLSPSHPCLGVTGCLDGSVSVYDTRQGSHCVSEWQPFDEEIVKVVVCPDHRVIALGKEGSIHMADLHGNGIYSKQLAENLTAIATNGQRLLIGSAEAVRIWDISVDTHWEEMAVVPVEKAVTCITPSHVDCGFFLTGHVDGTVASWKAP